MRTCKARTCRAAIYARSLCRPHYCKDYRLRMLRGQLQRMDIAPVVAHLDALRARGYSWEMIDERAHIAQETLLRIRAGELTELPVTKARRIFAIEPAWQHTAVSVPAAGSRRRRGALAWQGWSVPAICREVDLSRHTVSKMRNRVDARTAAILAQFYDDHAGQPGPDPTFAASARTRGALPWAAWGDDTIDDPAARPLPQRQWRRYSDNLARRMYPAEIAGLVEGGRSLERLSVELGFTLEALKDALVTHRAAQRQEAAA